MCQRLAEPGLTLRAVADALPRYSMLKDKLARPDIPWDRIAARLHEAFRDHAVDTVDGLRFSRDDEWLHVRSSGTEPVMRVIAESPQERRTHELIARARHALEAVA